LDRQIPTSTDDELDVVSRGITKDFR